MLLSELLTQYKQYQKAVNKISPQTQKGYCSQVSLFCKWAGADATVSTLTTPTLRKFYLMRSETVPKTVRPSVAALSTSGHRAESAGATRAVTTDGGRQASRQDSREANRENDRQDYFPPPKRRRA